MGRGDGELIGIVGGLKVGDKVARGDGDGENVEKVE
jgi:hypothetical protein